MKKLWSMLAISLLILSGCSGNKEASVDHVGDEVLTVWGFFEGAPKEAVDYYAKKTGKKVEYQTIGWEDYQTKLNTVLGTDDAPDLLLLERSFMGTYLGTENILSMEDLLADDEAFKTYKETTAKATAGPGTINDEVKAIGWENSAAAFFYRSDLAEKCLDIKSVDEMEKATKTWDDYNKLYEQLKSSDDATCKKMTMFGNPDYRDGFLTEAGAYKLQDDGSYVITEEYGKALETLKETVDEGMVYSPDRDKTQIASANLEDKILGNISPAWGTQDVMEYNQPGKWAIADTPLDFTAGGSYIAATPQADTAMVKEFLDMTFLNHDWLVDNMETFGMVGNETVMNKYLKEADGSNDYFGGQNTVEKFAQINDSIDEFTEATPYDSGLGTSLNEVYEAYVITGRIDNIEDAKKELESKLKSLYPTLEVKIQ